MYIKLKKSILIISLKIKLKVITLNKITFIYYKMSNLFKRNIINFIPVASPPYPESIELNLPSNNNIIQNNIKEWYLIQQETTKIILIINKSNILIINNDEIQLYNRIKYQNNNIIYYGRIINISNDRIELEQELRKRLTNIVKINTILTNSNEISSEQSLITSTSEIVHSSFVQQQHSINNTNWFLVQFERNENNCIVHSIIDMTKICWNMQIFRQSINQEIYFIDNDDGDNIRRKAIILYASNNRNEILNQMSLLTSSIFNLSFKNSENNKGFPSSWLLIQYSSDGIEFIYSIIKESKIIYKRENLYPDVVAFIKNEKKNLLYQAVILKRSIQKDDLEFELENIRTNSLWTLFPLDENKLISNTFYKMERRNFTNNMSVEYLNFSRSTQTDFYYPIEAPLNVDVGTDCKNQIEMLEEEPDYTEEELKIIRKLNAMEERMNEESHILRNAFYRLDRVNTNMDREIMTLEYLLSLPDIM